MQPYGFAGPAYPLSILHTIPIGLFGFRRMQRMHTEPFFARKSTLERTQSTNVNKETGQPEEVGRAELSGVFPLPHGREHPASTITHHTDCLLSVTGQKLLFLRRRDLRNCCHTTRCRTQNHCTIVQAMGWNVPVRPSVWYHPATQIVMVTGRLSSYENRLVGQIYTLHCR